MGEEFDKTGMTEEPKGFKAELKAYKKAIEEGATEFLIGYAAFSLVMLMIVIPTAVHVDELRVSSGGADVLLQLMIDWTIVYAIYKFYKAIGGSPARSWAARIRGESYDDEGE